MRNTNDHLIIEVINFRGMLYLRCTQSLLNWCQVQINNLESSYFRYFPCISLILELGTAAKMLGCIRQMKIHFKGALQLRCVSINTNRSHSIMTRKQLYE